MSDIEIAQACQLSPIAKIAEKLGISADDLELYGKYKAKLAQSFINTLLDNNQANGKLILVTAISPTPAGEGKTTTTIGLADALSVLGKKTVVCLREPSLGPVFGMKGGATGGGYAQVAPMEEINLHFTGDFHAIGAANNLLAALIDNHIYHGNSLQIDPTRISWRRCVDMNDRALRHITTGENDSHGNHQRETGFDIVVATEVMAVFCLATSLSDLQLRLGQMQIAYSQQNTPIFASDLKAEGAMTALLKDAFQPNLVQTLAHTPVLIHGGPFANIAHGCNSVIATKTALKLADYVVTEAGFGADLGAEKFIDIKCRQTGLQPDIVVLVATVRALKYHGGVDLPDLNHKNCAALCLGGCNLQKHIHNLQQHFGLQVIVAINYFATDTKAELALLQTEVEKLGAKAILCKHWAQGGKGAIGLAQEVLATFQPIATSKKAFKFLYEPNLPILKKIECIAKKIYGAGDVLLSTSAEETLKALETEYQHFPICIAKTQYSLSSTPTLRGAPIGHTLQVRELRLLRGAGFIVAICGDVMTMPGLPKTPASERIGVDASGKITGLA